MTLIENHFASIAIHFPSEDLLVLMDFMVEFYVENNMAGNLAKLIGSYPELRQNRRNQLISLVDQALKRKKLNIIEWDEPLRLDQAENKKPENTYSPKTDLNFALFDEIIGKDPKLTLLNDVLFNAKEEKINAFLSGISADSIDTSNLKALFQVLTILARRKRPGLFTISDELFALVSREDVKDEWKFEFAVEFIRVCGELKSLGWILSVLRFMRF